MNVKGQSVYSYILYTACVYSVYIVISTQYTSIYVSNTVYYQYCIACIGPECLSECQFTHVV